MAKVEQNKWLRQQHWICQGHGNRDRKEKIPLPIRPLSIRQQGRPTCLPQADLPLFVRLLIQARLAFFCTLAQPTLSVSYPGTYPAYPRQGRGRLAAAGLPVGHDDGHGPIVQDAMQGGTQMEVDDGRFAIG